MSHQTRAILTGHTRGLGAALAELLLAQGADVLAISRKRNDELAARYPGRLHEIELDLADLTKLTEWLSGEALSGFVSGAARVLLVNNAGMLAPVGSLADQEPAAVARAVSVNVAAPLMLAAAVVQATAPGDGYAHRPYFQRRGTQRLSRLEHLLRDQGGARSSRARGRARRRIARCASAASRRASSIPTCRPKSAAPDLERFPMRERFDALKRDGQLATPEQSAQKLVDYC